jgi:hypothetical protein
MSKAKRTALVTGASGLAGGYMLAHRRCSFGCFRIFGVSGSFRDLPSVVGEDWRSPASVLTGEAP